MESSFLLLFFGTGKYLGGWRGLFSRDDDGKLRIDERSFSCTKPFFCIPPTNMVHKLAGVWSGSEKGKGRGKGGKTNGTEFMVMMMKKKKKKKRKKKKKK